MEQHEVGQEEFCEVTNVAPVKLFALLWNKTRDFKIFLL
jgi:hypothetical protein